MHNLPGTLFRSKNACNPQSYRGEILSSAHLRLVPFYLHDVGKLGSHVLRYILVVEDNASFRDVFSLGLNHQPDLEVVAQAGSLAEARAMLEGIDVVIVDRGLPDGDGLELIGDLREASPGAALLVMSSTVEEAHPQQALDAGAAGILDKIAPLEEHAAQIRAVRDG
jgi:DNA-binding NarL/FixJ family response regulator